MLTPSELEHFRQNGFVAIRGAVPRAVAGACVDAVWTELTARGVRRDDETSWREPVVRVPCPFGAPFAEAGLMPRLTEAYDQLIGEGRWVRLRGVGGTVPVRFPSEKDPGDAGWHFDAGYEDQGRYRVSLGSRGRGLLALFLFTDVDDLSAPTLLRPGSHHDLPVKEIERGDWLEAAQAADAASAHRPVVRATGDAGDVFLCHPFLVHAASWPHRGRSPRILAQPAIALTEPYSLDDPNPPPVLEVIREALSPNFVRPS